MFVSSIRVLVGLVLIVSTVLKGIEYFTNLMLIGESAYQKHFALWALLCVQLLLGTWVIVAKSWVELLCSAVLFAIFCIYHALEMHGGHQVGCGCFGSDLVLNHQLMLEPIRKLVFEESLIFATLCAP
jgi:hypothetical protein